MLNHSALVTLACLLLVQPAQAQHAAEPLPAVSDVIYKGIVGKALDAVPMDPEERAGLQRTSAVVSSTLAGRSLSVWAGLSLSNPVLLIAGMAWGIFSATRIEAADTKHKAHARPIETFAAIEPVEFYDVGQIHLTHLIELPAEIAAQDVPQLKLAAE
jgi:hypothetical protein